MARRPDVQYIQYCTDGSLALQPEPVKTAAPKPVRKPAKRKRKNLYVDPLAICGITLAVVMLVLMLVGMGQLRAAEARTELLRDQLADLRQENGRLQADFEEKVDLDKIRWQAEALGLVPVDQVEHITVKAPVYQEQTEPEGWEKFYSFLVGLFA